MHMCDFKQFCLHRSTLNAFQVTLVCDKSKMQKDGTHKLSFVFGWEAGLKFFFYIKFMGVTLVNKIM